MTIALLYQILFKQMYNLQMKSLFVVFTVLALTSAIPYRDTLALLNSLQVGRNQDPMSWQCVGCDDDTKPSISYVIQEPVEDVKAILSVYEEYTVLAFRYTATIKNVFQDIVYAIQTQDEHACSGCKVQKQYDKMWNSIRSYTLAELKKYIHTTRLLITGISLGGGLANLAYVDIAQAKIFDNIEIVTFGAPRVGNKKWAAWFEEQTPSTRYFLKGDPIAALPVCLTPLCSYAQTGTPVKCDKSIKNCKFNGKQGTLMSELNESAEIAIESIVEYMNRAENDDEQLGGILDHIFEYKNVKEYTYEE